MKLLGWSSLYTSPYPEAPLTEDKKWAIINTIRKRHYRFTHQAHQTLPYCCPFFEDGTVCNLTRHQWDEVMSAAYENQKLGATLVPMDVIDATPYKDVLFEKQKYLEQFKEGESNG